MMSAAGVDANVLRWLADSGYGSMLVIAGLAPGRFMLVPGLQGRLVLYFGCAALLVAAAAKAGDQTYSYRLRTCRWCRFKSA